MLPSPQASLASSPASSGAVAR